MLKLKDIPFKLSRKINVFFTNNYVKKHFHNKEINEKYKFFESEDILQKLSYKDDTWNYISNLIEYMDYVYKKKDFYLRDNEIDIKRYKLENNSIIINSSPKNNNWICFFYKPQKKSYKLEYEFITHSSLEEIQIAFNCENLGERYRFMIHNDQEAVFECVHRGVFYLNIFKMPFVIEKDAKYKVTLIVDGNVFKYYINDVLIYSIIEDGKLISGDDIIIIFYNKESNDSVDVELLSCNISYIGEKK